jgi:hypothetical protein
MVTQHRILRSDGNLFRVIKVGVAQGQIKEFYGVQGLHGTAKDSTEFIQACSNILQEAYNHYPLVDLKDLPEDIQKELTSPLETPAD